MHKRLLIIQFLCITSITALAQTPPRFWTDVQIIKDYDRIYKPPVRSVLFVGSSSIRKWDDLQLVFGQYNVLNRGVGGMVISDLQFYLKELVFDYEPRQIVLYIGENDIPLGNENADTIFNRTVKLYRGIRAKMPTVPIVYIGFKPSPSREQFVKKTIRANQLISMYLAKEKNVVFIDVFKLMLTGAHIRTDLFVADMLHMNQQGYAIWEKAVRPHLLKYKKED